MLFPYTYVPHQMEKMQKFIDFIFFEVWCKAPIGQEFHTDLFIGEPDLQEVMSEFGFSKHAPERGKAFYKDVKAIYQLFSSLPPQEIDQFKQWYQGNNDIEKVCANDPATPLTRYADIPAAHKDLTEQLKLFFKELYSPRSLLDLAVLREKIGNINDHYRAFSSVNKSGKCPFCGISDLLGENHTPREAYDHYLPKALYPFNSINFRNLVPACHHCNSSYKTSKDPAHELKTLAGGAVRRKVFYPFATAPYAIDVQVAFDHADIEKLTQGEIKLTFGPDNLAEQIETWKEVYGIEERYRGKLLSGDGKAWLEAVFIEWRYHDKSAGEDGQTPDKYLRAVKRQAEQLPYANENFLKNGFLQACKTAGVFKPFA
jgi:hypothetical protein